MKRKQIVKDFGYNKNFHGQTMRSYWIAQGTIVQYPVINHNGKEYEKVHICVTDLLYCVAARHNIVKQLYCNKI